MSRTLYSLYIEISRTFVNKNIGKINLKISPWDRMSLAMSRCSGSFQLKRVANEIVKNTLRVEINQFCDGLSDTMRSSFAIHKI